MAVEMLRWNSDVAFISHDTKPLGRLGLDLRARSWRKGDPRSLLEKQNGYSVPLP